MPVFNPRNRLVNFRLSEEEFERLRASSALSGARSLSDFARNAVMRSVAQNAPDASTASPVAESRVPTIDRKVLELETRVAELVNLIESLKQASDAARPAVPQESAIGEHQQ